MTDTAQRAYFVHLPVGRIRPNPNNPRRIFDSEALGELTTSIKEHGVLQPIIVFAQAESYVLICGERRWRAAKEARLAQIPAIVHPVPPEQQEILSMMLVENLQRKEVDIVSESAAIRRLVEEHDWTIARVSRSLGAGMGFVRNRYLLTRFSDVLEAYTEERITFSQAIELANVENDAVRRWFFLRLESGELANQQALSNAVARDREIRRMLAEPATVRQPLTRDRVQFEVKGLPYCDPSCPHYCRLSWDEKQEYGAPDKRPGWAEYCADAKGQCYRQKERAKRGQLGEIRSLRLKRPISDDDAFSMFWLTLGRLRCAECRWMVRAVDLQEAGEKVPDQVHAYCTCPGAECYERRTQHVDRETVRRERFLEVSRKEQLRLEFEKASQEPLARSHNRVQMTKRECVYILVQLLALFGGEQRLVVFAHRHGWSKLLPAQRSAKVGFVRNKLMREIPEQKLHEVLLEEIYLSAAHSTEPFPALRFDRKQQQEIVVPLGARA